MNGITFGAGPFLRCIGDGTVIKLGEAIPEFDASMIEADDIPQAGIMVATATEAHFECKNVKINRRALWSLAYGHPHRWPVSNNWLKMHGYNMRRHKQVRKAVEWLNRRYKLIYWRFSR